MSVTTVPPPGMRYSLSPDILDIFISEFEKGCMRMRALKKKKKKQNYYPSQSLLTFKHMKGSLLFKVTSGQVPTSLLSLSFLSSFSGTALMYVCETLLLYEILGILLEKSLFISL